MKHSKMISRILLATCLMAGTSLVACVPKKVEPVRVTHAAYIDEQLRDASEAISKDMSILTGSSQNRDASMASGSGDLYGHMDFVWDGPLEGALSRVAAHAGFRFEVQGTPPKSPVIIHVALKDRPCLNIFREIGMQTGPREGIHVNEDMRLVTLRYLNDKGETR